MINRLPGMKSIYDDPRYLAGGGRATAYNINGPQSLAGGAQQAYAAQQQATYNGIQQNDVAGAVQPADSGRDSAEFSAAARRILNDMESLERKYLTDNVGATGFGEPELLDLDRTLGSLSVSERRRLLPLVMGMQQGAPVRRINAAGNTVSPDITNARLSYMEERYRDAFGDSGSNYGANDYAAGMPSWWNPHGLSLQESVPRDSNRGYGASSWEMTAKDKFYADLVRMYKDIEANNGLLTSLTSVPRDSNRGYGMGDSPMWNIDISM